MVSPDYTNQDLARDFYRYGAVYAEGASDLIALGSVKKLIEGAKVNIPGLYAQDGNLKVLQIRGIGPVRKRDLELILANGIDEALRLARERRDKVLQASPVSKYRGHTWSKGGKQDLVRRELQRRR
jgi:hypothetical protein